MLTGIHPIPAGELLPALDRLGHGDAFVVAHADVPAHRVGDQVVETPGNTYVATGAAR